jgi:hypothetical protein
MKLFKDEDFYFRQPKGFTWREDKYFKYFKYGIWVLTIFLMVCSLLRKPSVYEKPGTKMAFAPEVRKDMEKYALTVPLYSKPDKGSEITKNYANPNEKFIFLGRSKGQWIKVLDEDGDSGWINSYLLRFVPGK